MKVVFWGSPGFAVATLEALLSSSHEVVAVVTQPPRKKGRGRRLQPTPVAKVSEGAEIPVLAPEKPRGESFLETLRSFGADVFVVAAYGEILPQSVLDVPPLGSFNVHASLLPAYRGAAPVPRAILDGRRSTGATIMRMDAGLDTGAICLQVEVPIEPDDTAGTVTEGVARAGARLLVEALDRLVVGDLPERPQDEAEASYAAKVSTEEAEIDWSRSGAEIERRVRAFDPWPGAWTSWRGGRLKVYRVEPCADPLPEEKAEAGTLRRVEPVPVVQTGDGAVELTIVQPAGSRRMSGDAWARGRGIDVGESLGDE